MITLEALEQLATDLELSETQRRERLTRMIRAYARIVAVREPEKFKRRALEYSDEDGHYDNSFPPDQKFKDFAGPRLIRVSQAEYDEIATSDGFYHDWRAATSTRGLYVAKDGTLYGCTHDGSGSVGQFAAHPGNCGVMISLDWAPLDEVSTADLVMVEETMRDLAFPLVAAKAAR